MAPSTLTCLPPVCSMKAETSPADLSSLDFSRAMQEFPDARCCSGAQYRQLISSLPSSLDDMHRTCVVGRQSYARCGAHLPSLEQKEEPWLDSLHCAQLRQLQRKHHRSACSPTWQVP